MRYMLIRKADADTERGVMPSEEMLRAMADYNEEMLSAGVFVSGNGLAPSRDGARVEFVYGDPVVTDGPFADTRELIAGYSILEVESREEAIAWARRWPRLDAAGGARLELRRYYELADFQPSSALDQHVAMEERLARLPAAVNVHWTFAGNCREAMHFYAELLGGRIEAMLSHGETPAAAETPPELHDSIIHASLHLGRCRLLGADAPPDRYHPPQGVQVQLEYSDLERAEHVFNQLAAGGSIQMPFAETFWAQRFGMVTDRFGVAWMLNCECNNRS